MPGDGASTRPGDVLRGHVARLDATVGRLAHAETAAHTRVDDLTGPLRAVAAAGGVAVPVMVPPTPETGAELHPAVVEAEHIVRARALQLAARRRRAQRRAAHLEPALVGAAVAAASYLFGHLMAVRSGRLPVDAVSRVAAAQTMVVGRDPHPESVGFIWGPFPTVLEAPLALLRGVWPGVTASGLAAVVVSSLCLGGVAAELVRWGREAGGPRWFRLVAVALVVAHPLLLLYGANGMSEAFWLLCLLLALRWLARWWETDDVVPLAAAGVALGVGYLARYETLGTVAAVAALVAVVTWRRSPTGTRTDDAAGRARAAAVDIAVVVFPAVVAVVGWALASWVVVGEPLAQFTSQYGNRALVAAGAEGNAAIVGDLSAVGRAWFFVRQVLAAAPLAAVVAAVGLWQGGRTARRTLAAAVVLGAPVAAQALLAVQGQTFPWFRYVVPSVLFLGVVTLAVGGSAGGPGAAVRRLALVAALVPGVVVSWGAVRSGTLGAAEDARMLDGVLEVVGGGRPDAAASELWRAQRVAGDVDALRRAVPGAVLTDLSSTSVVVAAAPRPEVYVVPSDRDFLQVVADPALFGVRYLLLRGPATPGDAVVRAYPGLWDGTDTSLARLVRRWGDETDPAGEYRLFRVDEPRGRPSATPDEEPGR